MVSPLKYDSLLFGSAGVPLSAKARNSLAGIERSAELGLTCMEIEFVQGVKMSPEAAAPVKKIAEKNNIRLSSHAPYFINLNSPEEDKLEASKQRILQSLRITQLCGGDAVVFHAGNYMGRSPHETYEQIKKSLMEVINQAEKEGILLWLLPEVTGKHSQFGTIDEVLSLSRELRRVAPCIDVAHWHARTTMFNSYKEFCSCLEQVRKDLGAAALFNMHFHVSGIKYSKAGELRHLNLRDEECDFNYYELVKALKDYRVKGMVICESPNLEEDAKLLQETYSSLP